MSSQQDHHPSLLSADGTHTCILPSLTPSPAPSHSTLVASKPSLSSYARAPTHIPMPRVILARHGETVWSLSGQHTGRTDIPLTEHGEQVMRSLAPSIVSVSSPKALIDPHKIAHIFVSPRKRSQRTLQLLFEHLSPSERAQIVHPEIKGDCREWDYGAFEGLTSAQIRGSDPSRAKWDIWTEGTPDHPEQPDKLPGESPEQMTRRVDGLIEQIRTLQKAVIEGHAETTGDPEVIKRGGDILVVAHGHYNR